MANSEKGIIPVGGGRSRGLRPIDGEITGEVVDVDWMVDVPPEGNPALTNLGLSKEKKMIPDAKIKK